MQPPLPPCPGMPDLSVPEGDSLSRSPSVEGDCPSDRLHLMESVGTRDKGQNVPDSWVSYRITTDRREDVFECFRSIPCVIAEEFSKTGIQHYHVVVSGHEYYDRVKKRLQRLKLGRAMIWSAKNNGTFLGAVSYTVKCADYWTRCGFHRYVDMAPEWEFKSGGQLSLEAVGVDVADRKERDWQLTYSNLVCQAVKHARKHGLTAGLKSTLQHMMENTRWRPCDRMFRGGGVPDCYFKDYEFRMGQRKSFDMDWITPRF